MPPRWPFTFLLRRSSPPTPSLLDPKLWSQNILTATQILLVLHLTSTYIGGLRLTSGISMVPTIPSTTSLVLYSALHRRGRWLAVGDVVTFAMPHSPREHACKRIIGLPGDFVSVITPGREETDVEAMDLEGRWASVREEIVRVPEGHCWVAGDNLEWSRDSRVFGAIPLGLVKGKVVGVVLPWGERKWIGAGMDVKGMGKGGRGEGSG